MCRLPTVGRTEDGSRRAECLLVSSLMPDGVAGGTVRVSRVLEPRFP